MDNIGDKVKFDNLTDEQIAELAKKEKLADTIINGTMDEQHIETAVPLLRAGYDMLLEKPFAVNEEEMRYLVDVARKNNVRVTGISARSNVKRTEELAREFGILSIPTLIVLKDGKITSKSSGARPKAQILEMLNG